MIENRRRELQQQQAGSLPKAETKSSSSSSRTTTATNASNHHDKDRSPMHQSANVSPPATNSSHSERPSALSRSTLDSPAHSAINGGLAYSHSPNHEAGPLPSSRGLSSSATGRSNSPAAATSYYPQHHPSLPSHSYNTLPQSSLSSSASGSQISNGKDDHSHPSYGNNNYHLAGK